MSVSEEKRKFTSGQALILAPVTRWIRTHISDYVTQQILFRVYVRIRRHGGRQFALWSMFATNSIVHILMGLPLVICAALFFEWNPMHVLLMLLAMSVVGILIFAGQFWLYLVYFKPRRIRND